MNHLTRTRPAALPIVALVAALLACLCGEARAQAPAPTPTASPAPAGGARTTRKTERQGAFIAEIEDDESDPVITMETDWIAMRLYPQAASTVVRFVFRPTQNEILEPTMPKNMASDGPGGGLLQDNVWEQDWRFQELRGKYYDYKITKSGPEEVQVVFETKLDGWLMTKNSGIKSRLLENLIIRRTVTLKQGTPYFLFDLDFATGDDDAKLPLYWCHNGARINLAAPDHMLRPSDLGINRLPTPTGSDFVYNFNHGWSAEVSPERKEGVVFLMDYDYLSFLYNCGVTTSEWVYDNLLVTKRRPVHSRIYVLPTMGLEKVDHATEHFICQLKPIRADGRLRLQYKVVSSYEKARKITFVPEVEFNLLDAQHRKETLAPVEFTDLSIEPTTRETTLNLATSDPLKIRTTAFIDLADGKQITRTFDYFHVGDYAMGANITRDLKSPVALLERAKQNPYFPVPEADQKIDRDQFNVFAILGNHSRVLKLEDAIRAARPDAKLDVGYHPGFFVSQTGLTDFPYDYDRLFKYRALVLNNSVMDIVRGVGLFILQNYIQHGGGLVLGGGENTFGLTSYNDDNPIYKLIPYAPGTTIVQQPSRLNSPATDHPIFQGVDLSDLPWQQYVQKVTPRKELPAGAKLRVLLKAGDEPLVVEYNPGEGQRIMIVLALPFGDPAQHPGQTPLQDWPGWKKLYGNIVRYAGHDL
ncbi:MAG: hypothetical protein NTW19_15360 [Planctomycetota bacterium]|nr:hypothetical protein [Planctomycetota bacterium]